MRYHTAAIVGSLVKIAKEPSFFDPDAHSGSTRVAFKLRLEFEKVSPSNRKQDSGYYTLEFLIKYGSLLDSKMEFCEIDRPIFKDRCRAVRFTKIDVKKDRSGEIYFSHSDCGEQVIELSLGNSKDFSGSYKLNNNSRGAFTGDYYERNERGLLVSEIHIRDIGPTSDSKPEQAELKVVIKDFELKSLSTT